MDLNNTTGKPDDRSDDPLKGFGYGLLIFVLVFVNVMVLVAFKKRVKKKRGIPDLFIANMAMSALLTNIFVITIVAYVSASGDQYFIGLDKACYIQTYFGLTLRLVDVAITTGIAIDRFIALRKPIFYRTKVKMKHGVIVCCVIWCVSCSIGVVPFLIEDGVTHELESICTADWRKLTAYIVLTVAYSQFVIVLICYIGIYRCIKAFINRQKAMTESQAITYNNSSSQLPKSPSSPSLEHADNNESFSRSNSVVSFSESVTSSDDENDAKGSQINKSFEAEITDKLCEISKDNIKLALDKVKNASNIEVETSLKVRTERRSSGTPPNLLSAMRPPKTTSASVDLRIKAAINRVSWSTLPEVEKISKPKPTTIIRKSKSVDDDLKSLSKSDDKTKNMASQDTVIVINSPTLASKRQKTCRRQTCPDTFNVQYDDDDEVFEPESSVKPKEKRAVSLGGEKVLRSLSILIQGKLNVKRLRRQSSNLRSFWSESERFAKIMGVVVLIFYISWLPLAISINISLVSHPDNETAKYLLRMCYNLSLLSNLAIPLAYSVMCKPYRKGYKMLWKFLRRPSQHGEFDVRF